MQKVDKDHPSAEWIAQLRRQYPCESEIDRVLTRKLLRRAGPAFAPVTLEQLVAGTKALLRKNLQGDFTISKAQWMTGGASKVQMSFHLEWNAPAIGHTVTPLVLRMEPSASIAETSRRREFQLSKALAGHIPVPRAYWCDAEGEFLPYPAIIYEFVNGVTKPSAGISGVTGIGTSFPLEARPVLATQFVDIMAAIHRFNWRDAALDAFDKPMPGTAAAELQLNWWMRVWEEDAHEEVPLLKLAIAWMRQNLPVLDQVSLVHGDYRSGNFLYDERSNRITAILDWETGRLGDRHQDLAFMPAFSYGSMAEDGKTFLLGGLMSEEALYEAYEKTSGLTVLPDSIKFYKVLNVLQLSTVMLATGYRCARCSKTHQDVLMAWVMGFAPVVLDNLRRTLEQIL